MQPTHYFAYGSNLNVADFDRFCVERGFATAQLQPFGPARLPGYRLAFSHFSQRRGGGALNVHPCPTDRCRTHQVEGVLFRVRQPSGWHALDLKEGCPHRYQKVDVAVRAADQAVVRATTYIVQTPKRSYYRPTGDYVAIVAEGLRRFGLGTEMLQRAAADELGVSSACCNDVGPVESLVSLA